MIKCINKDEAECVILAGDTEPIELIKHIPSICEEKSIPYCYIASKRHLGRACGISRPVVCCCI